MLYDNSPEDYVGGSLYFLQKKRKIEFPCIASILDSWSYCLLETKKGGMTSGMIFFEISTVLWKMTTVFLVFIRSI